MLRALRRAPDAQDRLHAAEVAAVYDNVAIGVLGATAAAMALALSLLRFAALSPARALAWVGSIAACAAAHLALRSLRRRHGRAERWRPWALAFTAVSLLEGLCWGWAPVGLVGGQRLDLQLLVFVVCFGIAAGAVPAFGAYLPAFLCLFLPITVPELAWSLGTVGQSPQQATFAMITTVFILAMGGLGLRSNGNMAEIIRLRIRADDLAADLRHQKELAEGANRAKSAFLAAASHDLRQPVHALSLFVGALRNVALPAEAGPLVDQIEASTLALDGLFGAILDISRLDAGVVAVEPVPFALDRMIERICGDHAAEAQAKGLALRRVPSSAVAWTDPVLMERILRNLVVNAIRHTRAGRVLVGVRRRGGRAVVEVRDTGPGIPPAQQQRIFDEYVQLNNPERDRVKGLGLGLAIVRRLCDLLACPVSLRSDEGLGACFSVSIPLSSRPAAPTGRLGPAAGAPGERGLVLVIDDERAIQEGMARLLGGWGYRTVVAGSGAEMLQRLSTCPDVPVLIVCDYRLRDGETGPAAIERLQSEYNDSLPALLITGDTDPSRLAEAQASGLLLLHKPVPNARLRAAIGHLIASARIATDDEEGSATVR